ncbi:hypothetical protein BKA56DRAFT_636931 [Ilyonectria sp. MPI-CAGE-AT-0026]|nr:hypothetical protein BKA56DRAFT_636931 [Ilyonectria sp. MPI-CAGE-AT-0026]
MGKRLLLVAGKAPTQYTATSDGQRLASGSDDKTIKIWDTATGACLQTLEVARTLDMSVLPAIDNRLTEIASRGGSHPGYGVSTDGIWIVDDGRRMLWLPPECRASAWAVVELTVAVGCGSGRVLVMKFS